VQIQGSVGSGGRNNRRDVYLVQILLNVWRQSRKVKEIKEDGLCGPETIRAIEEFQKTTGWVDGRVDVEGRAFRALRNFANPYLIEGMSLIALGFVSSFASTTYAEGPAITGSSIPISERNLLSMYAFRQKGV
jgi:hypothetical protein